MKKKSPTSQARPDQETQQSLSTGLFIRSLALARLALNSSGDFWNFKGSGAEITATEQARQQELLGKLEDQAREIARELGTLKGSVMKVGQMLALYGEHFLPPQVNRILKVLQSDSPSLEWSAIEPFVKAELGHRASEIVIDTQAIAAASIGQVHSAKVVATGETIALKIQYPGVEKSIASDMKALKTLAMFAPGVPRGPKTTELIAEIEEMLWREVDYSREADAARKFASLLAGDSRFLVPKVLAQWSTTKILATQMICGHRLDSNELKSLSQERRNAIADSLLDLYLRELFEFGCVQTDAHIGNYKVRLEDEVDCDGNLIDRDHVVLLDFGAIREFDPAFVEKYRRMIAASLRQNLDDLSQAGLDLGFLKPCDPEGVIKAFYDFCRLVVEPFDPEGASEEGKRFFDDNGNYDWSGNTLPQRLATQMKEIIRAREFRAPPREAIFLDRKSSGLYILLSSLGAKTNTSRKLREVLKISS